MVMEIGSLNENEEVLEQVYREQLDAVIFTVNQYTTDLFDFYTRQVEYEWLQSEATSFFDSTSIENWKIEGLAIRPFGAEGFSLKTRNTKLMLDLDEWDSLWKANEPIVERLIRYKEANYLKLEPIGHLWVNDRQLNFNLFIVGSNTTAIIFYDPILFIEETLSPKIQEIAGDDFNIFVADSIKTNFLLSSPEANSMITQSNEIWMLPTYQLHVQSKGQTIESIIEFRAQRNILILSLLILLLVTGAILVAKNLRKEIQLSKAKADFVANVSHEIRTPLSLISMFNETLLLDRVKDEKKKKEYYEIISKETSRLKNIVNKILSFSQIDADKKQYDLKPLVPDEVVNEVVNTYSYHLEDKGFEYILELNGENTSIMADREAFIEVIINLIDNAIKYSLDTKFLTIISFSQNDSYILEVSDKGMGIDPKKKHQVFEKFYRVESGEVHNTKGTGLGLSLVSGIVKAHNGSISLNSKLGAGSTFKLTFPIAKE